MSRPKTFKRKFTTPEVTAVFPTLHTMGKFGDYTIDVDLFEETELEQTILAQAAEVLAAAQDKLGTTLEPSNSLFRKGEFKSGERQGQPFYRACFKMKGEKQTAKGVVKQRPIVVDSQLNPVTEPVFGGSRVKVGYEIQYTLMPNNVAYLSLRLKGVQVLKHVGPGGEASADDFFGAEDGGFVSAGETVEHEPTAAPEGSLEKADF